MTARSTNDLDDVGNHDIGGRDHCSPTDSATAPTKNRMTDASSRPLTMLKTTSPAILRRGRSRNRLMAFHEVFIRCSCPYRAFSCAEPLGNGCRYAFREWSLKHSEVVSGFDDDCHFVGTSLPTVKI